MTTRKLGFIGAGLAAAAVLGACGGDSSSPSNTTLNDAQAGIIGQEVASQVGAIAGGLGNLQFSGGGLTQGFFSVGKPGARILSIARRIGGPKAAARIFALDPPTDCIPIVVGDSSDTDGDGIPNGVTYVFNANNCTVIDTVTGYTITVTGSAGFQDTDDADTFFGYAASFGQWTYAVDDGQTTSSIRINGTSGGDVGTGAVSGSDHYSVRFDFGPTDNITVSQNWDTGYTPDQGQVIDPQATNLPPGDFDINGNFGFTGVSGNQSGNWSFAVTTATALAFDPACTDENQVVGGSIRGAISANSSVGFTVDFNGCGNAPTVAVFGNTP